MTTICQELDKLWTVNGSEVILFTWFNFLENELLGFLSIQNNLTLSSVISKPSQCDCVTTKFNQLQTNYTPQNRAASTKKTANLPSPVKILRGVLSPEINSLCTAELNKNAGFSFSNNFKSNSAYCTTNHYYTEQYHNSLSEKYSQNSNVDANKTCIHTQKRVSCPNIDECWDTCISTPYETDSNSSDIWGYYCHSNTKMNETDSSSADSGIDVASPDRSCAASILPKEPSKQVVTKKRPRGVLNMDFIKEHNGNTRTTEVFHSDRYLCDCVVSDDRIFEEFYTEEVLLSSIIDYDIQLQEKIFNNTSYSCNVSILCFLLF